MAPLGGKESTQRCHWGETRLPLDASNGARQAARKARKARKARNRANRRDAF
jgi:hypothetical protein